MPRRAVTRLLTILLLSRPLAVAAQPLSPSDRAPIERAVKARAEQLIEAFRVMDADRMFSFYDDSLTKTYGGWRAYDGTLTLSNEVKPDAREQLRKAWAQGGRQTVGTDKFEVRALSPTLAMSSFAGKNEVSDASGKVTNSSLATMTAIWAKHQGQWYIIEQHMSFQPTPK